MSTVEQLLGASALAEARKGMRAGQQLRAQLLALASGAGTVVAHAEHSWSSITFTGSRHTVRLRFEGDDVTDGEALIEGAPGHEFIIPGHRVTTVSIVDVDHRVSDEMLAVTIEVQLLEDD